MRRFRSRAAKGNLLLVLVLGSLLVAGGLLGLLAVYSAPDDDAPDKLVMFCAAGLRVPVEEIAAAYLEEYHVKIEFQYGGSQSLLGQLEVNRQTAADLYLAGDDFTEAISRRLQIDPGEAEALKIDPRDRVGEIEESILPTLDDLGNEIQLSFDYYENQFDKEVEEVYISGGSAKLPGLARTFEGNFDKPIVFTEMGAGQRPDTRRRRTDLDRGVPGGGLRRARRDG